MKRIILVLLVACFSFGLGSCGEGDACDRAETKAESQCAEQGYDAQNCKVIKKETNILGNVTSCFVECECYESYSRQNSAELMSITSGSCTIEDEDSSKE